METGPSANPIHANHVSILGESHFLAFAQYPSKPFLFICHHSAGEIGVKYWKERGEKRRGGGYLKLKNTMVITCVYKLPRWNIFLQFACGLCLAMEDDQDGNVSKGMGWGGKMVSNLELQQVYADQVLMFRETVA